MRRGGNRLVLHVCLNAVVALLLSGHITRHEAAARLEVSVSTFDRWMRRDRERER